MQKFLIFKTQALLILIIFLIAIFFRFINLSSLPTSLSIDEVTFGYAGYSVLHTAHDEFGKFLPLAFQGVGDFKPPVDVYLNVITEKLFGLTEFAVRVHGALLGALTCILLVFLLRELGLTKIASLFGGFWLAISPWHIFFSRAGYEAITALFFLVLGAWLFLRGVHLKSKIVLYLSFISFSLSVWSYHAERIFVPLLFLTFIIYFKDRLSEIFDTTKSRLMFLFILSFFALPFLYLFLFSKEISARAADLWIGNSLGGKNILEALVGQYLNYFDLKFLFAKGLNLTPRNFQDIGLFSLFDIPLVIVGLYTLLKTKNKLTRNLLLIWLFLYPIPGGIARGDPSPIRALVAVPVFAGVASLGFEELYIKYKKLFLFLSFSLMFLSLIYFFDLYIYAFPKYNADIWNYGYKEVAQYVCTNYSKYNKVIITDKYGIELPNVKTVPHYYILFYCKINPAVYLTHKNLYNIDIRQPQWRIDSRLKNTLLVGSRWDFPEDFDMSKIIKTIYFPNGKPAFYFVETNK